LIVSKLVNPLLLIPFAAALALLPQDPQPSTTPPAPPGSEPTTIVSISELQYLNQLGAPVSIPARNVVEVRLLEEYEQHVRIELIYDNGDYSLLDTQGFHLLRNNGGATREVRLVRGKKANMRFPRLP
jgi:hypothetical protein